MPMQSNWVQLVFATPVVLWAGWPFFVRGAQSIATRNLNMFTLIAIGIGVAWVASVVATATQGRWPELAMYLPMARAQGWTEDELAEVLLHLAGYVGLPTAREAMLIAKETFAADAVS